MQTIARLPTFMLFCAATAIGACDAGPEAQTSDSNSTAVDARVLDDLSPPPATDAGTPPATDALAPPAVDAGSPPIADAEPPPADAGPPPSGAAYPWPKPAGLTVSGPLELSGGERISGLKITNPNGDCIKLANGASDIVIEKSEIGPCKSKGIHLAWNNEKIIIRDNYIHDTGVLDADGRNIDGEAIYSVGASDLTMTGNLIEDAKAGYFAYRGDKGRVNANTVFSKNFVKNVWRGNNGGNMAMLGNVNGPGIRINDNIAINVMGESNPEDVVNLYKAQGVENDPIQVSNNMILGGGPRRSSGGIILADQGGAYQLAENNVLVNMGQYGLQIGGGHHVTFRNNRVFSDDDPIRSDFTNVGVIIWRYSSTAPGECYGHTFEGNHITFWRGASYKDNDKPGAWLYPIYNPSKGADGKSPNCGEIAGLDGTNTNTVDEAGDAPHQDGTILPPHVWGYYQ